jgi:endonuclease YncB( thermonuclease family)
VIRRLLLVAAAALAAGCVTIVTREGGRRDPKADQHDAVGSIVLNGERTKVLWSDGDSFDVESGPYEGQGTRLVGFNTLEAYGPVHRWGSWKREELFDIAKSAAALAASEEWDCTTAGEPDAYGRLLVDCPKLARVMAREGVGLAYAVRGRPAPRVLDAMHQAQRARRGMWAKGVPDTILTALHSRDEDTAGKYPTSVNRVLDTHTGEAALRKHLDTYQTCEEVCVEDSCMVYVPFERRYKDQPPCLVGE